MSRTVAGARRPRSGRVKTWLFRASGPALVVALAFALELLGCRAREIPNLGVLILASVLYSTFVGGAGAGLVGGALALGYYAYCESIPGMPFRYTSADLVRVLTTSGGVVLAVFLLRHLYRRLERQLDHQRSLRVEADRAHRQATETLDSITDGFFSVDREWRYTFINRAAAQRLNKPNEELLGRVLWDVFPSLVGSAWEREYRRAVAERVVVHFEAYHAPLDGWFEARAYPSTDGLAMYLTDITQRKRAEEALEVRLRQQAAVAALGLRSLRCGEPQELMDEAVATIATTLGVDAVKVLELLPGGDALLLRAGVGWKAGYVGRATVDTGHDSQAGYTLVSREPVVVDDLRDETRFRGPGLLDEHEIVSGISVVIGDGEYPYGVLGAHAKHPRRFTADDANFVQAVANLIAMTVERARADASLRESEARFRQLAENIREVSWLADAENGRILYVSPAYEEIWGRSRESLYERQTSWLESVHPEDRGRMEAVVGARRHHQTHEFRIMRPAGDVRMIEARLFPVANARGAVFRVVGVARDVTAARQAEEAALRLEREAASRVAAEAAVRARDEVLTIVSHDLRNPLNSIMMGARLLQMPLPEARRNKQIEIIERAAERMKRLIEDLLDIGRIESGKMEVVVEPLCLEPLLKEAREALEALASERSLHLDVHVEGAPRAYIDRDRFLQALSNLVENAIKFTPPGASIAVRARLAAPNVEVEVADTGSGIPPDQLPHIFDRFWQACRTDRRGAGLGLSIVKGIVEAHGGRVWATSQLGQGTSVYFALPAQADPGCPGAAFDTIARDVDRRPMVAAARALVIPGR